MPDTTPLQLHAWHIDEAHAQITLLISSTQVAPRCPGCDVPARHVHSRYTRTLADLPWSSYGITWQLRVRKLFCCNPACPRRIFTERLPGIAAPWARRTMRLMARLLAIGLALGGAAGVRLSRHFGLIVSRNTLLRVIRHAPCPVMVPPQVLSVDDFALRKRHTYGTLLLDLERRRPLALLPDREAATGARWLQAHPGVEVLVRDRAEAYAEAARLGAPLARQVADRFQLLHNLADVLTDVFRTQAPQLARVNAQHTRAPTPVHDPEYPATVPRISAVPLAPPQPSTRAAALAAARRAQRVACYEQVWMYHRQGWTLDAMAHQVGLSRRTVQRYLQSPTFPERPPRHGRDRSLLDPYTATLLAGWNHGCRHGSHLFRTIRSQGFRGQYGIVALYVRRMRQAQRLAPWQRRSAQPLPAVTEVSRRPLTPRRATWLALRPSACATDQAHHQLAPRAEQSPELAEMVGAGSWAMAAAAPQAPAQPYTGQVESINIDHCDQQPGTCAGSLVLAQPGDHEVTLTIPAGTTIQRGVSACTWSSSASATMSWCRRRRSPATSTRPCKGTAGIGHGAKSMRTSIVRLTAAPKGRGG